MNVDRLVCGLATVFDVASRNGGSWSAEAFSRWLELDSGLSMRVEHDSVRRPAQAVLTDAALLMYPGTEHVSVGRWSRFAAVASGSTPAGLLALGEVDTGTVGDGVLGAVRDGTLCGLSLGAWRDDDHVVPYECSLTTSPAYDQALILGTGAAAARVFEMLAGQRVEV